MTKYYYTTTKDKELIKQSFYNIAWLVFGKKNTEKIETFRRIFETEIEQVNIYPQGTNTTYLSHTTPGICRLNENNKIIIEMLGYSRSHPTQHSFIKHEGTHELCHAFANILPKIFSKTPEGIIKKGIKCKNHMGMIKESNPSNNELVGQHYYGKMFNETMMDIITSMSINTFNSTSQTSVDNVLYTRQEQWGNSKTSYSIFTSITRLTIAAFSNNGFINYQNIVNAGYGIFDATTLMNNGETLKANDFLYGILFDQLHIEHEFDKFMGEGSYRIFCEYLDRLFIKCLENQEIPSEEVKLIMNILPDFINRKINYYKQHGLLDKKGANKIIGNFNHIWNSMQTEYQSFFSQNDIDEIARRAGKKNS